MTDAMLDAAYGRRLGPHAGCPEGGTVRYRLILNGGERFCDGCGQSSHQRGADGVCRSPETVEDVERAAGASSRRAT